MSRFLTQGQFRRNRLATGFLLAGLMGPVSALAQSECTALLDQLDQIEHQGGALARDEELDSARTTYQQLGCPNVPTDPGCQELGSRINRLQNSGGGNNNLGRERQRVVQQLRRAGCTSGDGVRRAWGDAIDGARNPEVFEDLYREGGGENVWQSKPGDGEDSTVTFQGRSGSFRTLCVRKCDGYYWPISFSARASNLAGDAAACQASCPNQEVELFHHAPGQLSEEAVSASNEPYAALANAFVYRNKYVPACACKTDAAASADKVRKVQEQEEQKAIDAAAKRKAAPPQPQDEPQADIYRSVPRPIVIDPSVPDRQETEKATAPNGLRGVSPGRSEGE